MNNFYRVILFSILLIFGSCEEQVRITTKPIIDYEKKHIGDSIFYNDKIKKIVFYDSTYIIDSLVYSYGDPYMTVLASLNTYKAGKKIFENVEYYGNGNVRNYKFICEGNPNHYYERRYSLKGDLRKVNGYFFFQGYLETIPKQDSDIKRGTLLKYKIFYPNPPDCTSRMFIKNDDSTEYDVFSKVGFINFLQIASSDNNEVGIFKINVALVSKENKTKKTETCERSFFIKVVP